MARGDVREVVVRVGDVQEVVAVLEGEGDGVGGAEENVGGGDAADIGWGGELDL